MAEKIVLAYSGGLDTSVAIKWLKEKYGYDVIAFGVDVGNEPDFPMLREKAEKLGAIKAYVEDAREVFVKDYVFPALQANVMYEGQYPLATALGRPLIAKLLVDIARREGATAVGHGCTGKGNDQVRFDVSVAALAPDLKIVAPAREWDMTREETIRYADEHGIPIPITSASPYSIDQNLWGRSIECGVMEDPWNEPPDDAFIWARPMAETPDTPEYLEVEFEQGIPVALNGQKLGGIALLEKANEITGRHGIGRIDHIEDRITGIKSREIYEAPAAMALIAAHRALEAMTLSKDQLRFNRIVSDEFAELIYTGLWFTGLRENLRAYIKSNQPFVTGTVRLKLFKGFCHVVGRKSPKSLYRLDLATYDEGDIFDQRNSEGFIHIWGLPAKIQTQAQGGK
ncbi:argininosuccinate synthase [Chloroflexota bacterium]